MRSAVVAGQAAGIVARNRMCRLGSAIMPVFCRLFCLGPAQWLAPLLGPAGKACESAR
jgi:hypothetical protein